MKTFELKVPVEGVFEAIMCKDKDKYLLAEFEIRFKNADFGCLIDMDYNNPEVSNVDEYQCKIKATATGYFICTVVALDFDNAVSEAEKRFDNANFGVLEDVEIVDEILINN